MQYVAENLLAIFLLLDVMLARYTLLSCLYVYLSVTIVGFYWNS